MRKATFDKRMIRLRAIADRASVLPVEEARTLVVEAKAVRQFNGLMRDFLRRYTGYEYQKPEEQENNTSTD